MKLICAGPGAERYEIAPCVPIPAGANVTDLSKKFDTSLVLSGQSDIVAHLVLAHQTQMHKLDSTPIALPRPPQTRAASFKRLYPK